MSIEAMAIALHHSRATGTAKLVLLGIASHDGDGGSWPSRATLAKYAGIRDQGAIRKAVNTLIDLREVRRHINGGGGPDRADYLRPNRYEFLLECPPHCDRSSQHRDTRRAARYMPRYLDIPGLDYPADSETPGANQPPHPADDQPGDGAADEPPELNPLKPAIGSTGPELNADARAGSKVPTADEWHAMIDQARGGRGLLPVTPRPPCPKHTHLPCTISTATGLCIDCGLSPEQLVAHLASAAQA